MVLSWSAVIDGLTMNPPDSATISQPSILSLANKNTTHSLIHFPASFEVRVRYGDHPFRLIDLLRNGVAALHPLALRDAEARTSGVHYYFRRVGDMIIDVQPTHPATDVSNEIALMCIYFGIKASLTDQKYVNARYDCILDEVEIAHVTIEPAGHRLSSKSTTKSPATVARISESRSTLNNDLRITNTSLKAFVPTFDFRPDGQTMTITAVFLTAMTAITHWGRHPKTERLPPYTPISPGGEWDAHLIFIEATPRRVWPPFFESRWAIEMAKQLPFFCVASYMFAELDAVITVDGVIVGAALLLKELPHEFASGKGKVVEV